MDDNIGSAQFSHKKRFFKTDNKWEENIRKRIESLLSSWCLNVYFKFSLASETISDVVPVFVLLPWIFPRIRVFSNESVLHISCPKDWSFSFSISPSSEYSRLISFRMDWLDLLAVQETLKSLLQHHSSKASVLQHSAFFIVQHSWMTTGKTTALTRWTFVGKVNVSAF